jgi:hypothetical protein
MRRRAANALTIAHVAVAFACLSVFVLYVPATSDPVRPDGAQPLARWVAEHPADFVAASSLSDQSLDSDLPRRFELWRAAHRHATHLAPLRENTTAGFVRAGLFHWPELSASDRASVLRAASRLLADQRSFEAMAEPLWRLTHDLRFLERSAPDGIAPMLVLQSIALKHGRFEEYGRLREAVRRERMEELSEVRARAGAGELLALLPPDIDRGDDALARAVLTELARRPATPEELMQRGGPLLEYALDQRLDVRVFEPLTSESRMPATLRRQLAEALADPARPRDPSPEWSGTCGPAEVCAAATRVGTIPPSIRLSVVQSDEVAPYVEILIDDAIVAEGPVADEGRTFALPASEGIHKLEVRLANPWTRGAVQRRLRLS